MSKKKTVPPSKAPAAKTAAKPVSDCRRPRRWSDELIWQYDPSRGGYKQQPGTPYWRELQEGDLVLTDFGATLAQFRGLIDGHVRLVLLHDTVAGNHFDAGTCRMVKPGDVRLLPPLPLAVRPRGFGTERSWLSEFEELLALVRAHLPPSNEVRRTFEVAVEDPGFAGMLDDVRPARQAVEGFYAKLPFEEQRRVLNGWTPHPVQPTADAIRPGAVESPRLAVEVWHGGQPMALAHWELGGLTHPCRVTLYANTTKATVLNELHKITAYIDEHWQSIQDTRPEKVVA